MGVIRGSAVVGMTILVSMLGVALPGGPAAAAAQEVDHLRGLVPFGFSGASAVVRDGTVAHSAGYGFADWESRIPIRPETVFDIGSLSKQFTAAAVLLMAERKLLSLEDSIAEFLPYVPEDKRGITIHHLLTHTSGLPPFHAFGGGDVHGDFLVMTRRGAERAIMGSPLDFPPGEGWTYSNSGYTLLAAIVERVADRPFEEVLWTDLFEPAGMKHTGLYFQSRWNDVPVAHGYRGTSDQGTPLEWTESDELWALIGGGGVLSTVGDLARWHQALRNGTVLSQHAVDQLFTRHVEVRESLWYGYGWYIEDVGSGERVVRHGGANDFGFAARWRWHVEDDLLVILLMNREPPGMDVSIAASAVEGVLDAVARGGNPEPPPGVPVSPGATDLDRYVGRYRFGGGDDVTVATNMGSILVQPLGPVPTRHLAFPAAPASEREAVARIDKVAGEIVDGMVRGEYEPLGQAMANSSRLGVYRNYIVGWWDDFEEAGATRDDVKVLGTVPSWWSLGDNRLATVILARVGDRTGAFRLHWQDGSIAGLGGGAVEEPATTLFTPTASGTFIGYHLGIRSPVSLSFDTNATGEITGLRLYTPAWTLVGLRVRD